MLRREFLQSAAAVASGHALGLPLLPPLDLHAWYTAHCASCGYLFPDADPNRWSFEVPPGEPPYIECSVCIWHGPRTSKRVPPLDLV